WTFIPSRSPPNCSPNRTEWGFGDFFGDGTDSGGYFTKKAGIGSGTVLGVSPPRSPIPVQYKVLVGESLVKQSDPGKGIANLFGVFGWKLRRIGCVWQCGRETVMTDYNVEFMGIGFLESPRGSPLLVRGGDRGSQKFSGGDRGGDGDTTPRPRTGPMPIPSLVAVCTCFVSL
ncbi:hypothetical protein Drorol1_Dr00006862, partial [Drosera rotundifolia]